MSLRDKRVMSHHNDGIGMCTALSLSPLTR
jgi:hypothetical protein